MKPKEVYRIPAHKLVRGDIGLGHEQKVAGIDMNVYAKNGDMEQALGRPESRGSGMSRLVEPPEPRFDEEPYVKV